MKIVTIIRKMFSKGSITINGETYHGNVNISADGRVLVDGVEQSQTCGRVINIVVNGDVTEVSTSSGDIVVNGNAGSVQSTSGDIRCGNVTEDVQTTSGDITCGDILEGDARSVSGDINRRRK